ncbi:MAG TPA: serine/threonine-protein kinase [Kofleriaceae bacterium]|jgi:hypothetical protein
MKLCPKCQKQFSDDANFCPVDAARLAPLEPQAGAADGLAARFDLGQQLGGSRTGAVHRATDKATGSVTHPACVVKLVARSVVALPGVAQRLERELKQLERVTSPGVAKVLASGKRGEDTWVAIELLDGAQTLAEAIGARGPIPQGQAADLIEVIGEALIEAAQVGVVHRDLAPKNVLFAGQDVKLINFSLPVPTSDKVPGVPEFVSPEQVDGRSVDQRSNLYSLGALYYYVLTGTPPFTGTTEEVHRQHQTGGVRPPSVVTPGINVPPQVEAVIMRALDRSPTKRFLTVRQFVDEVMRVGHGEVIELKPTARPVARPKGELVQTLMGIRSGGGQAVQAAAMQAAAMAPTPQQPQPAPPIVAAAQPRPATNPLSSTVVGVPAGAEPAIAAARAATPAPVAVAAGPVGMKPLTPPHGVQQAAPSPWAAPGSSAAPTMPVPAAPIVAPPIVAAPIVAAPVVAAPVVAQAAAAKKKGDDRGGGTKGKFRETMWFKKGELDAHAATAAADERARTGKVVDQDKADSLPIDERYKDDGSITRGDKEKYSLRTGSTMMMESIRDPARGGRERGAKVSEDELIGEMKSGRTPVLIGIAVAVIVIALIVFMIAR